MRNALYLEGRYCAPRLAVAGVVTCLGTLRYVAIRGIVARVGYVRSASATRGYAATTSHMARYDPIPLYGTEYVAIGDN